MASLWKLFSAIGSRLVFIGHGIWSLKTTIDRINVGKTDSTKSSIYWTISIPLCFLFVEGFYNLIKRKGEEYKL